MTKQEWNHFTKVVNKAISLEKTSICWYMKVGNLLFFSSGESPELLCGGFCTHPRSCRNDLSWRSRKAKSAQGSRLPSVAVGAFEVCRARRAPDAGSQVWRRMRFGSLRLLILGFWRPRPFAQESAFHLSSNGRSLGWLDPLNLGQDWLNTLDNLHKHITENIISSRETDYTPNPPTKAPWYLPLWLSRAFIFNLPKKLRRLFHHLENLVNLLENLEICSLRFV